MANSATESEQEARDFSARQQENIRREAEFRRRSEEEVRARDLQAQRELEQYQKQQMEALNQRQRLAQQYSEQPNQSPEVGAAGKESRRWFSRGGSKQTDEAGMAQELEESRGRERLERVKEAARERAKQAVEKEAKAAVEKVGKKAAGAVVKQAATAAASAAWSAFLAALPYILIGVAILIVIALLVFLILWGVSYLVQRCNDQGLLGTVTRTASWFLSKIGVTPDVCAIFQIKKGAIPTTYDTASNRTYESLGLAYIQDLPVAADVPIADRALRGCLLPRVQLLRRLSQSNTRIVNGVAQAAPIDWVITSAWRDTQGPFSYHQTGEAVDIALRPQPSGPPYNDWRIARLVYLAEYIGFTEPAGNALDEYNHPSTAERGYTGGHIHLEYNFNRAQNQSYCDLASTTAPPNPPAGP